MTGTVLSIATSVDEKRGPVKVVAIINTDPSVNTGADKLVAFDVPGNLADGKKIKFTFKETVFISYI